MIRQDCLGFLFKWVGANYARFTNRDFKYAAEQFYDRGMLELRLEELMIISSSQ